MKVLWSPRARSDLLAIRSYLMQHSPRAAQRIVTRIVKRVAQQREMPYAAPVERDGPERCLVIGGTPYLVLYTVSETVLTVAAVYHGMRQRS